LKNGKRKNQNWHKEALYATGGAVIIIAAAVDVTAEPIIR
jgi:hypothetical protein